jgi:hypothetical protein
LFGFIIDEDPEKAKENESKPPMLVVEIYDSSTTTYSFVREVPLYKNDEFEPYIKDSNSVDFLKNSSFATNGQALVIQTHKSVHFFDLKTGIKVQKVLVKDGGVNHEECNMTYDYQNNLFYSFKYNTSETKLEAFTLANFKKGGATSGFNKLYLTKRVDEFKAAVYGEEKLSDNKPSPHQLNLIQRIMKNVTTPVLISHSRGESKVLSSTS